MTIPHYIPSALLRILHRKARPDRWTWAVSWSCSKKFPSRSPWWPTCTGGWEGRHSGSSGISGSGGLRGSPLGRTDRKELHGNKNGDVFTRNDDKEWWMVIMVILKKWLSVYNEYGWRCDCKEWRNLKIIWIWTVNFEEFGKNLDRDAFK